MIAKSPSSPTVTVLFSGKVFATRGCFPETAFLTLVCVGIVGLNLSAEKTRGHETNFSVLRCPDNNAVASWDAAYLGLKLRLASLMFSSLSSLCFSVMATTSILPQMIPHISWMLLCFDLWLIGWVFHFWQCPLPIPHIQKHFHTSIWRIVLDSDHTGVNTLPEYQGHC